MSSAAQLVNDNISSHGWRLQVGNASALLTHEPHIRDSFSVPVWCFEFDGKRVKCDLPVQIRVTVDNDGCRASCDRLHVHAGGDTLDSCFDSLHMQIVDFFEDYVNLAEDQVTGLAAEVRRLYVDHFVLVE